MRVPGLDPGIDPRIHVFGATTRTWMAGTSPGDEPGHDDEVDEAARLWEEVAVSFAF